MDCAGERERNRVCERAFRAFRGARSVVVIDGCGSLEEIIDVDAPEGWALSCDIQAQAKVRGKEVCKTGLGLTKIQVKVFSPRDYTLR